MLRLKMIMKIIKILSLDVKVSNRLAMGFENISILPRLHIICKYNKKKIEADLRGFESVIDYLLHSQEVTRDMFDRQIDMIMRDLAPVMQKYAKLLQRIHGLDNMRFEDLKISVDPDYEPEISIEDSKKLYFRCVKCFR